MKRALFGEEEDFVGVEGEGEAGEEIGGMMGTIAGMDMIGIEMAIGRETDIVITEETNAKESTDGTTTATAIGIVTKDGTGMKNETGIEMKSERGTVITTMKDTKNVIVMTAREIEMGVRTRTTSTKEDE
jgi:hypothetical protein